MRPILIGRETSDELQAIAEERHDTCVYADACDRARDMHSVEQTHDWLRCETCEVWEQEYCPMSWSGTMRCVGPRRKERE